jgi:hypothetical protein
MGYGLDDQDSIPGKGLEIFLYYTASRLALEPTQILIQKVPWNYFPWGKVAGE